MRGKKRRVSNSDRVKADVAMLLLQYRDICNNWDSASDKRRKQRAVELPLAWCSRVAREYGVSYGTFVRVCGI